MKLPSYNNNDNDNIINHKSTIKNVKIKTNNIDDIRVRVIRKLIRALIKNNNVNYTNINDTITMVKMMIVAVIKMIRIKMKMIISKMMIIIKITEKNR